MQTADTASKKKATLIDAVGVEAAEDAAMTVGLTLDELFSDRTVPSVNGERGAGEFLSCIKGKVDAEVKAIFDVNAIAVLIGQENYFKAAKKAVDFLARQGIRKNAVGIAAVLAYHGARCSFWK